ncbi:MAG: FHA domain-containing protein [Verrucomicrobiota bacterium]
MSRLLITGGTQQGRVFHPRAGLNRIGRSAENDFQIPDPSVSGVHCEIVYSDTGIDVRDLGSTNGTYIDGARISQGRLQFGQVLQVGNIEMRLEDLAELASAVAVSVPELPTERLVASTTLADGSLSCANHPEVPSRYVCNQCQQGLCDACVRIMQRITKDTLVFCSLCNGQCEHAVSPSLAASRKKGLFGRLTQTLRMTFKV